MPFKAVRVGEFEIIAIQAQPDRVANATDFFPASNPSDLDFLFAQNPSFFSGNSQDLKFTQSVFVVRTESQTILIDTGIPVDAEGAMVLSSLREAGISADQIHTVVLTHRDLDHVGGGVADGKPVFRNARYVIGQSEYQAFRVDASKRDQFAKFIEPLSDLNMLDVVPDDAELVPEMNFWLTPGHRSAATSVLLGDVALFVADVWHCPIQVTHPEWSIKFDSDPDLAATTRLAVIDRAERDGLLVAVPHSPFFGLGHVLTQGESRIWRSLV